MTVVLVPVKELHICKSRLSAVLSQEERKAFSRAMLEDVLYAISDSKGLERLAVVSRDPCACSLARFLGAMVIPEPQGIEGESAAVKFAGDVLARDGIRSVMVLPMDVPLITPEDVELLLRGDMPPPFLLMAPSKDGGTNAMLQSPPNVIPYHFGQGSLGRHLEEAKARGILFKLVEIPNLSLDIDSPEDLARFIAMPSRTRAKRRLLEMGVTKRFKPLLRLSKSIASGRQGSL